MSRHRRELVGMLRFSLNCLDLESHGGGKKVSNSLGIDKGNELTARDSYVTSSLFSPPSSLQGPDQSLESWQGAPHNRLSGVDSCGLIEGGETKPDTVSLK
jgi:hypothetical protein